MIAYLSKAPLISSNEVIKMHTSNLSTDAVSELFFIQIRRLSIEAAKADASYACSVNAPDLEVAV